MSARRDAALEALAHREHSDPHALLGAHAKRSGVVIRALRPGAVAVSALLDQPGPGGEQQVALEQVHPAGIFQATVKGARLPLHYRVEAIYPEGPAHTQVDPYVFLPTLGELDLYLIGEGHHERIYELLGAHPRLHQDIEGTAFAVWAPGARSVSVVGDFNFWNAQVHPMRSLGSSGVWELFIPGVGEGSRYKFDILTATGERRLKADPYAQETERPPQTASVVTRSRHAWSVTEHAWRERRATGTPLAQPVSIYEVHLGSWRQAAAGAQLNYSELGHQLGTYAQDMGFTHVELMPVMAHPFAGSWGYQVTGYYAPTPRYGSPDDLRALVQTLHEHGVGVILDWVPAHFPRDDWALARFDGTALYEHADPRRGAHPDWGTLVFNFGRHEVRNFLTANALYWLREFHADGLRVDAVASMLYLDYSRGAGEWVPNQFGGREDLEAVAFLKELNELVYAHEPGVISAAEESTAWPGVSRPTYLGGLGFGFKWNMGWMHDTLGYLEHDPVYRRYHHNELTFSLVYAFTENFILPLSHDEVVHGKGSLYQKMAGDHWQKLANLRVLYGLMWAHPGKKLLFMGGELAQKDEWDATTELPWELLQAPEHAGIQALVRDLNRAYREYPALWELDSEPEGFFWLEPNDADANLIAFARQNRGARDVVVFVGNFAPVPRPDYRVGLPRPGPWREALNTDSRFYGGADLGNAGEIVAEAVPWHGQPYSARVTVPPLAALWLVPERQ
ncbi:1,4-alpha-glucan branching protein GlgB [Conexibacter sp. S30A1]|uniref:1,4-alpha-glucan branching protein GlgB n=1 Tax=Conexibacter sp. S30A1 TaxID=2937800 RepID=UPI00200D7077|nr:1,4-alpha-glucan branching protein GlgB [Conexibacter sp. S30A1]